MPNDMTTIIRKSKSQISILSDWTTNVNPEWFVLIGIKTNWTFNKHILYNTLLYLCDYFIKQTLYEM